MSDERTDFLSLVLAGKVRLDEIDDYVSHWHAGGSKLELYEYLGMTWDEYAIWVTAPEELHCIVESRAAKEPAVERHKS
jgi:hypothetical protein